MIFPSYNVSTFISIPFSLAGYLVYRSCPSDTTLFCVCFALSILSGLFGWEDWGSRMLHQLTAQESESLSMPTCDTARADYESELEGQIDLDKASVPLAAPVLATDDILADRTARIDEMLCASRRARLVHDFTLKPSDRAED